MTFELRIIISVKLNFLGFIYFSIHNEDTLRTEENGL